MDFNDLNSQYNRIQKNIDRSIAKVLEHGKYIMGPEVFKLEKNLENVTGVNHVISCANGTDALVLALMAIGVKKGDAVFCPTFTYFATAEAVAFLGATPVFIDSEQTGFNLCIADLESQITQTHREGVLIPKAIIAVDLFGLPVDYKKLTLIAKKHCLKIIEDGAQSFGGKIGDAIAPSFGDIATTSFFPSKPLGCYGDGGAVFTNNEEYASIIKSLRVHGKGKHKYDNVRIGMNSRLDTIQAAILIEKLKILQDEINERENISLYYNSIFGDRFEIPIIPEGLKSSWAQYTLLVDNRDEFRAQLANKGIPTAVYYEKCLHQQQAFLVTGQKLRKLERAELLAKTCVSLPMHVYQERIKFD